MRRLRIFVPGVHANRLQVIRGDDVGLIVERLDRRVIPVRPIGGPLDVLGSVVAGSSRVLDLERDAVDRAGLSDPKAGQVHRLLALEIVPAVVLAGRGRRCAGLVRALDIAERVACGIQRAFGDRIMLPPKPGAAPPLLSSQLLKTLDMYGHSESGSFNGMSLSFMYPSQ